MKITSKKYGEELEIFTFKYTPGLSISVESFKVPEGYKSFAFSSKPAHENLTGCGFHKNKNESVQLAITDIRQLMTTLG